MVIFQRTTGLWDMAARTASDPTVRIALVPSVLETKGLDVTPGTIKRLRQAGDEKTARYRRLFCVMKPGMWPSGHAGLNTFAINADWTGADVPRIDQPIL